jgi:hypothetical protein
MSEYRLLTSTESAGRYGQFGIKILVATELQNLDQESICNAAYAATDGITAAIMQAVVSENPEAQENRCKERADLLGLFEQPIYAEEIPNGYCSQWCCKHLPWFIVTTTVGRFKIGWRKRVISIDWSDSIVRKTAEELFPGENVTKDGRLIHAWSLDDARRYIAAVIADGEGLT